MNYTLTIGRIVWYKLDTGPHKGEYRPAIVVRVFGPTCVNLQVFLDGSNDHPTFYTQWVSSASYGKDERQWLWPNEVQMEQAKKRLSDAFDSWELAYKDWLPLTRHYIDHEEEDAAFYRMVFARQELQSAFVELKQLMTPDEFRAYISEPPSLWKRLFRR